MTLRHRIALRSLLAMVAFSFVTPMFGSQASAADTQTSAGRVIGSQATGVQATADEADIAVSVVEQQKTDDGTVKTPVAGVTITATGTTGPITGTTDATGKVTLKVPKQGDYEVVLDTASLPTGVEASPDSPTTFTVSFSSGVTIGSGAKTVNFFVGDTQRVTINRWELLPQTLVNGIKYSLIIAMCAIGLSLIYGTTGLTNFAHGEIVTIGALVTFWLNQGGPELHLLVAAPFGVAASALLASGFERQIWRPLRRRGISLTSMTIVSIGLAIGIRYVYLFFFGGRNRRYRQYVGDPEIDFGPFGVTPRDLGIMAISTVVVVGVSMFLLRARLGKAIRAVSDNPDLASATGINTNRIILTVWLIGGALAGLGGVMLGAATGTQWDMGNILLLLMFAAITVGGLGNPFGALVGAFVVGMFTELWTWVFPNVVELKTLGALITLVVILLVRPQGFLGKKERIG
ncbi:MAG: branched-chain amino acid ABC transporter permease [Actinomycetota bacterium]